MKKEKNAFCVATMLFDIKKLKFNPCEILEILEIKVT